MSYDDLKQDVERFLGKKTLEESDIFGPQHWEHVAEQEITNSNGIIHLDNSNHTQAMRSEIVQRFRDKIVSWRHKADEFKQQLLAVKSEHSAAKASKELSLLTKEMDEAKEEHRISFTRDNDYGVAKKAHESTSARYEGMLKKNASRPPKTLNMWLYLSALLIVGAVEALINYSTFNSYFGSQGLAYGSTIMVALIFAAASHFHGEFWKQRLDLMGPDVEKRERNHKITVQLIVTTFFLTVFAGLILVRYEVVLEELSSISFGVGLPGVALPGQESIQQPSVFYQTFANYINESWGLGIRLFYFLLDA